MASHRDFKGKIKLHTVSQVATKKCSSLMDAMLVTLAFTNEVYTSRIKCSMRVNIKIFYLKEV